MRRGFTILEMLVATALVMLMMLLFAEVFGAAIGTMTAQRGIANNDQKARSFTTVLRHDLAGRTYRASVDRGATREIVPGIQESPRGVVPIAPGDLVDPRQRGYLYVSENDVDDDTDDVLQFTGQAVPTAAEGAQAPYYGRSQFLQEPDLSADPDQFNPNQPERDDGIQGNGASFSRAAEIAYFVRGGNLYRRVMLLRDPLPNNPPFDTQPTTGADGTGVPFTYPSSSPGPAGPPYFNQPYTSVTTASFYNDWDFSGTRILSTDNAPAGADPEGTDTYRFHFHALESLDNALGSTNTPLGIPWNRFGFYSRQFSSGANINRPVEYLFDGAGAPIHYIGRFTHEETSHALFDWPGIEQGPGANIMLRTDLLLAPQRVVAVDANTNGSYDAGDTLLLGGRSGEDILLTNVEAFDVEVWDPGFREDPNANGNPGFDPFDPQDDPNGNGVQDAGSWVETGNGYNIGYYRASARANPAFGPGGLAGNRVFDTWHPGTGVDADGNGQVDVDEFQRPPYRPLQFQPTTPNSTPATHYTWQPAPQTYNVGDVFFPDALGTDGLAGLPGVDDDGDGNADTDPVSGFPDPEEFEALGSDDNLSIGFVASVGGTSGALQPTWPRQPGTVVQEAPPGTVRWECFDNRVGLERIRITVRYRDVGTGQARQVTLVHSLVD